MLLSMYLHKTVTISTVFNIQTKMSWEQDNLQTIKLEHKGMNRKFKR